MFTRRAYGQRIRTSLPLPGAPVDQPDGEPDWRIRAATLSDAWAPTRRRWPINRAGFAAGSLPPPDSVYWAVRAARPPAQFHDAVLVAPRSTPVSVLVHCATGQVTSVLASLIEGCLAFHGAVLARGNETVLFAGASGAGKSSLAARLLDRGWRFVSDECSVLRLKPHGAPAALPGWRVFFTHARKKETARAHNWKTPVTVPAEQCAEEESNLTAWVRLDWSSTAGPPGPSLLRVDTHRLPGWYLTDAHRQAAPPGEARNQNWLETFARLAHAAVPGYELRRHAGTTSPDAFADFVDRQNWDPRNTAGSIRR